MIPQQYITEWSEFAPWTSNEQIEQDLIICRSLVELFSDEIIAEKLAFRGGTALHKLFLETQPRYSEDIDLVQISAEPFGPSIDKIRKHLSFLGEPKIKQKDRNTTMVFNFESEIQPTLFSEIYTCTYRCFRLLEGEETGKPPPSLKNGDMKKRLTMICILFTREGFSCPQVFTMQNF